VTTKKNTLLCKTKKKKELQVRNTPSRKKEKNLSLTLHNLWEKNIISTPPPL
jgi:hypothetical protein